MVDSSDSLLDVDNLVNNLSDDLSEVNNLLVDDWSLWSWSGLNNVLEVDNLLLDDLNSLDHLVDLLLEDSDDMFLFWVRRTS